MNIFRRKKGTKKVPSEPLTSKKPCEYGRNQEGMPEIVNVKSGSPKVIVGLDFGTTFSGFAYAIISDGEVQTFYDYPRLQEERIYCKTLTGLYYKRSSVPGGRWQLKSWGYPARTEHGKDIVDVLKQKRKGNINDPFQPSAGFFFTRFKLYLVRGSSQIPLPPGISADLLITDYLRGLGEFILRVLQLQFRDEQLLANIQWCITVPSIWENDAKDTMKRCMANAGLVGGNSGSPHPLIVVLEPEAASFFCRRALFDRELRIGDKMLVADIGGGTADLVAQEVVSVSGNGFRVRELSMTTGGLCGGSYVDLEFMKYLRNKIGPALEECQREFPQVNDILLQKWEQLKTGFGDPSCVGCETEFDLPKHLADTWEQYDKANYLPKRVDGYEMLDIKYEEMQSIFDPIVKQNLDLIAAQLDTVGSVKALIVVGGFAASQYLAGCITERFGRMVSEILIPPNPASAICHGAVELALNPEAVVSRICKKTYGFHAVEDFEEGVDREEFLEIYDGVRKCKNRFEIYVRKGESIEENVPITKQFMPIFYGQKAVQLELYSSSMDNPRYIVGDSVRREGKFLIDISKDMALEKQRRLEVAIYFGKSSLEIRAKPMNFSTGKDHQLELPVESGFF